MFTFITKLFKEKTLHSIMLTAKPNRLESYIDSKYIDSDMLYLNNEIKTLELERYETKMLYALALKCYEYKHLLSCFKEVERKILEIYASREK